MEKDGYVGWANKNVKTSQNKNYTNGYLKERSEKTGQKIFNLT